MTRSFSRFRPRILFLSSMVILTWAGLTVRFFYIQVVEGNDLREKSKNQSANRVVLSAVRGTITDRNLSSLAENIVHYSFAVHPKEVEDPESIMDAFSEATGHSREYYKSRLESSAPYVFLERNLKKEVSRPLLLLEDKGLVVERRGYRFYPHHTIACQVIGFTDVDNVGLEGIEKEFDRHLKGRDGWIVLERDGKGRSWRNQAYPRREPVDGSTVVLTLDLEYQAILQDELNRRVEVTEATGGMGIIIEPHTGRIRALVSLPGFDPNDPASYPRESYKNRVVIDQFEPGSTFKIVPATAALSFNTVDIHAEFNCEDGSYAYRGSMIEDWSSFGLLTFPQIIENSSNVGTVKIAETVGPKGIYTIGRKFGFGTLSGISFPGEVKGVFKNTDEWSGISLAEISLGYEVSVTALQLALAYGAVANGGFLMTPILVDKIIHPSGGVVYESVPQVVRRVASRQVMEELTRMLCRVVETGTGTRARIEGWHIAGKTGTAKKYVNGKYSNSRFIASFVGFFPASNPVMVAVIVLDEPKLGYHWGGTGAAPVFREVVKRIINSDDSILVQRKGRRKNKMELASATSSQESPEVASVTLMTSGTVREPQVAYGMAQVPNVRGRSLRSAIAILRKAGLRPRVRGSGIVVWQSPSPGTVVKSNSSCIIGLN